MLHEHRCDAHRELRQLRHGSHDLVGHEVEAARPRAELDLALNPHSPAFWRERANGLMVAEGPRTRTRTHRPLGGAWIRPSASGCAGGTRQATMSSFPPRGRIWLAQPRCSAPRALSSASSEWSCPVTASSTTTSCWRRPRAPASSAAVLLLVYDRMPPWGFHVVAVLDTALFTAAAYGWGSMSVYGPLPYVWVTGFVFYFFTRSAALVHLAIIAAAYAVALVQESPAENPLDGWIATVATLLVTGYLISVVRDRLSQLIAGLSDAAHHDPLTDLLNRRGFQEVFDVELERARRADQPLSLIVGDLDRFKRVNDVHGHAAGDAVLRRVADAIRTAKRGFDRAARVGGEEFAILAPDSDEHGAYMLAERIRAAVNEAFADQGDSSLTISFGISTHPLHGRVGRRPPSYRGPGALRRQAPRPQPLGDLERGGARDPRPRRAWREQRGTRGAGGAHQHRRGARRARQRQRHALPARGPLRGAHRSRARPATRERGARTARGDPARRRAVWLCPTR